MFKKLNESIVQNFIQDLNKDKIFVELAGNQKDIKGFKWHSNNLTVLKQTQFTLYTTYDTKTNKPAYSIKYDLFKHKNIESLPELYRIAQEKMKSQGYKDKIEQYKTEIIKEISKAINKATQDITEVAASSATLSL